MNAWNKRLSSNNDIKSDFKPPTQDKLNSPNFALKLRTPYHIVLILVLLKLWSPYFIMILLTFLPPWTLLSLWGILMPTILTGTSGGFGLRETRLLILILLSSASNSYLSCFPSPWSFFYHWFYTLIKYPLPYFVHTVNKLNSDHYMVSLTLNISPTNIMALFRYKHIQTGTNSITIFLSITLVSFPLIILLT